MFTGSIFHTPGTLDACPLDGRMFIRLRAEKGLVAEAWMTYVCDKNLWFNARRKARLTLDISDSELDYFSVSVPMDDTRFAYIFELTDREGKLFYLSEEGLSETYEHDLGYFSFFQYTSQFPCDLMRVPEWVKTAVGYQIFPERFDIGNAGADKSYVNAKWGAKPTPRSFYGGDLDGVTKRLDYVKSLGVSFIYLTPVFKSISNHKYDIMDYENVDPAFGGNEALKRLIEAAHDRGMRIILDGVFNHTSNRHPFFVDALKNGKKSKYFDWYFINPDGTYRTFGSVPYMPKLNTGNPEVISYFSSVCRNWMRDYGVDGWRLDVSDEISRRFLRRFREEIMAEREDAIIIGEDWHVAANYLNGDEYDGTMNYGFTKACLDLFAFGTIDSKKFVDRLIRLYYSRSVAASEKMLNLLDSHDTDRFLTRVKGDARKQRAAIALMFFYPGIPCVYYGDEIGTEGGYDPDSRRTFDWNEDNWDKKTLECVKTLAALKKDPALSRGGFNLTESGGLVSITRTADGRSLKLTVNATGEANAGLGPWEYRIEDNRRNTK